MVALVMLRWFQPPITGVQLQRRVEAYTTGIPYQRKCTFVPLQNLPEDLQHAVITAEDKHFYEHHGFDWSQIKTKTRGWIQYGKRPRASSTITQQLVKNLFFTTHRSIVRKALESIIVLWAELVLPKRRILELYLNVIEWGPGIYGGQAAARHYYDVDVMRISREQAIRLTAILPSPRRRRPEEMNDYSLRISDQMKEAAW